MIRPSTIWNEENQTACEQAWTTFQSKYVECYFKDPKSGDHCVNTKIGHANGHQNSKGTLLEDGEYISPEYASVDYFSMNIKESLERLLQDARVAAAGDPVVMRRWIADKQMENHKALRSLQGSPGHDVQSLQKRYKSWNTMCYSCIIGRIRHRLPCGDGICDKCMHDFDNDGVVREHPGWVTHKFCIICGDSNSKRWPHIIKTRPRLAGVRVLSLDGGGVRGIVQLKTLARLEGLIGLGISIGQFFDLAIGSNIGE